MSLSQPPIGTVVTTDPVTGLPLTSSDPGIIDQIPFNSDPRALQDWNATARASSSIYPDDYPWVMSTNHAQNSTNPQMAQSMQTDGNHRLLVNTGSSGGGGVSPVVMNDYLTTVQAFTHGPDYQLSSLPTIGNTLYGYSVSVGWSETIGPAFNGGVFKLYIFNATTGSKVTLVYGQISDVSSSTRSVNTPFNQTVMYPIPRDITAFIAGDPTNLYVAIENTQNLIEVQIALFTS